MTQLARRPRSRNAPPTAATAPAAPTGTAAARLPATNCVSDASVADVRTPTQRLRRSTDRAPSTATTTRASPASTSSEPTTRRTVTGTRPG